MHTYNVLTVHVVLATDPEMIKFKRKINKEFNDKKSVDIMIKIIIDNTS